jgi:hypothetical protein
MYIFFWTFVNRLWNLAGKIFQWLCQKEIDTADIPYCEGEAAEILCHMEMHLPLTLFDIQFHHLVHLPGEVGLYGPMSARWMYFVERYMGELKGWVRQRARPEGSMAQGYLIAETMHYVSEYSERFHSKGPKLFDVTGNEKFSGIVLPKSKTTKVMSVVFHEQAWRFLLLNTACLELWRRHHALEQHAAHSTIPFKEWLLLAVRAEVEDSGQKPDQMVWDLAVGLAANADFSLHVGRMDATSVWLVRT